MIRFECPHCGKGLRAEPAMAGAAFNCPECRGRVSVPTAGAEAASGRRTSASTQGRFTVRPYRPAGQFSARRIFWICVWVLVCAAAVGGAVALVTHSFSLQQFWLIVIGAAALGALLGFIIGQMTSRGPFCLRCKNWKRVRQLGTAERDLQSAKEALEAGDLAALGALSPEGETIRVSVYECPRCMLNAPIDVKFAKQASNAKGDAIEFVLAEVTYPGAALPAFERLCKNTAPV
jgi:hypothetical protein